MFIISFVLSFVSVLYCKLADPTMFVYNSVNLPWHIEYMFQAMFWMVLGYLFKGKGEQFFDKCNNLKNRIMIIILYFAIIVLCLYDVNLVFDIIATYLKSVLGIIVVVSISKKIVINKYMSFVGRNTLLYFALHGKVLAVIEMCLDKMAAQIYNYCLSNFIFCSIINIMIALVVSIILIIPVLIVNKYFPWTMGKLKKYKTMNLRND